MELEAVPVALQSVLYDSKSFESRCRRYPEILPPSDTVTLYPCLTNLKFAQILDTLVSFLGRTVAYCWYCLRVGALLIPDRSRVIPLSPEVLQRLVGGVSHSMCHGYVEAILKKFLEFLPIDKTSAGQNSIYPLSPQMSHNYGLLPFRQPHQQTSRLSFIRCDRYTFFA